jgi:hypothetical protein
MVAQSDLAKVQALNSEYQSLQRATQFLNDTPPGKIVAMTIGPPPPPEAGAFGGFPGGITVRTDYMEYPQAMVDSIKASLNARVNQVRQELGALGITGLADIGPTAATRRARAPA